MEIKYNWEGEMIRANLSGELDEYSADYVRASLDTILNDLCEAKCPTIVLDFKNVSFMDSTGIGVLLGRYNKFMKNNVKIQIDNAYGHIDRILSMTGIYQIMPKIS